MKIEKESKKYPIERYKVEMSLAQRVVCIHLEVNIYAVVIAVLVVSLIMVLVFLV